MIEGYLVVLKSPKAILECPNPNYRGLFRTRPFFIDEYEKGFDDPYFSGKYTDEHGLIFNLPLAKQVLQNYIKVENPADFEIIFVGTNKLGNEHRSMPKELRFLGFDIACFSPFWSIVVDLRSAQLNANGLFNTLVDAVTYYDYYLSSQDKDQGLILNIWEVYNVEPQM